MHSTLYTDHCQNFIVCLLQIILGFDCMISNETLENLSPK